MLDAFLIQLSQTAIKKILYDASYFYLLHK